MGSEELSGCVAVETSRRGRDDHWLIELSENEALISAVVLNLQPDLPGFEDRLHNALGYSKFAGIRLRPIEQYVLDDERLLESFGLLERGGKTVELGAKSYTKKLEFAGLARMFPGITWILDHCGHPGSACIEGDWRSGIVEIARLPNTVAKVTGLAGDVRQWRPILDVLADSFGPDRLLYGSNWPVSTSRGRVIGQVPAFREYFGRESAGFFFANASRVYRIDI